MVTRAIAALSVYLGSILPSHASDTAPQSCALKIFQVHVANYASTPAGQDNFLQYIHIRAIEPQTPVGSSIQFYEAQWTLERPSIRALLAVAGDSCHLIASDLDTLLGVEIPAEDRWAYASLQYNEALGNTVVPLDTDKAVIEYGFSIVRLVDPYVRVHGKSRVELLWSRDSAERLWTTTTKGCTEREKTHKRALEEASKHFAEPTVTGGRGVRVARFCTWLDVGGAVRSHNVYILDNGHVAISTALIATHLGPHDDPPSRNRPKD